MGTQRITIKWDLRIGTSVYLQVADEQLKQWIQTGRIKADEAVVRNQNLVSWQKPEELKELQPFFKLYEKSRRGQKSPQNSPSRKPSLKKAITRILLVDDEEELCFLIGNSLRSCGFQMEFAHSRREALLSMKKNPPDLVILDLHLPDGDGMDLLPVIRKVSPLPAIIITTAYGSEETRRSAFKMGVYYFLDKPYNEEDVISRIRQITAQGS